MCDCDCADPTCIDLGEDCPCDCHKTYKIVRFVFQGDNEDRQGGLTLEDAQEWCDREDTHGDGWFDGYTEE